MKQRDFTRGGVVMLLTVTAFLLLWSSEPGSEGGHHLVGNLGARQLVVSPSQSSNEVHHSQL